MEQSRRDLGGFNNRGETRGLEDKEPQLYLLGLDPDDSLHTICFFCLQVDGKMSGGHWICSLRG